VRPSASDAVFVLFACVQRARVTRVLATRSIRPWRGAGPLLPFPNLHLPPSTEGGGRGGLRQDDCARTASRRGQHPFSLIVSARPKSEARAERGRERKGQRADAACKNRGLGGK